MKKQLDLFSKFAKNKVVGDYVFINDGRMYSTDLEATIVYDTEITGTGAFSLSEIKKVLGKYPDANIQIQGTTMHVTDKGKAFKFSSMVKVDDFPTTPKVETKVGVIRIDKQFKTLQKFLGTDELRPAMTGVCIDNKRAVATDAHRLRIAPNNVDIDTQFILPKQVFNVPDGEYTVYYDDTPYFSGTHTKYARLSAPGVDFVFATIDGRYPDVDVVMPKVGDASFILRVPTKAFSNLLDDCLMVANKTTNRVVLKGEQCKLTAEDVDFGREYEGDIEISSVEGEPFDIAFQGTFMKECLYDVDVTELRFFAPNKAMLIDTYTLLMPVMMPR
jgi:DNA polymerase III sliding clamp (beta) subunit (PCNA family)